MYCQPIEYVHPFPVMHRRRIYTEAKAKVVANVGRGRICSIPCHASYFASARNWINYAPQHWRHVKTPIIHVLSFISFIAYSISWKAWNLKICSVVNVHNSTASSLTWCKELKVRFLLSLMESFGFVHAVLTKALVHIFRCVYIWRKALAFRSFWIGTLVLVWPI